MTMQQESGLPPVDYELDINRFGVAGYWDLISQMPDLLV